MTAARVSVVEIPWAKLVAPDADLSAEIIKGFGPEGLGIVTVSGVPEYEQLRAQLLPLAQAFAELPADVKAAHEHAGSRWNVGWSHGKEALRSGLMDTHKGSFYANPLQDTYAVAPDVAARHPAYYSPNIWPTQHLPALEPAVKALGGLMVALGLKLAGHCSRYVQQQVANATGEPLSPQERGELDFEAQLAHSNTHKARLLHYFPVAQQQQQGSSAAGQTDEQQQQQAGEEDWCGWHLDHGSLTGLCSAIYLDGQGRAVPNPDPAAGLYICNRAGNVVQAAIPATHIAFQMGQVMAIQSGGLLRATPHCVRAAAGGPPGVSRNTFAVFMQPDLDAPLKPPAGLDALGGLLCLDSGHWEPGMAFGEFAEHTLAGYYQHTRADSGDASPASDGSCEDAAAGRWDQHGNSLASPKPRARSGSRAPAAAAAGKDVAPASVHMAVAATGRSLAQLMVLHD